VTHDGNSKPAAHWVPPSGHAKVLRDVQIRQDKTAIGAFELKHQKGTKESLRYARIFAASYEGMDQERKSVEPIAARACGDPDGTKRPLCYSPGLILENGC